MFLLKRPFSTSKIKDITIKPFKSVLFTNQNQTQQSINNILNHSPFQVSKNLDRYFNLTCSNSLLFRKSTLELIEQVERERVILVQGKRGVGKSATLYQLQDHYKAKGWIVIYFPKLSEWTSGLFPYSSQDGLYNQNELAKKVLDEILVQNEKEFSNIEVDGKTLCQSIKESKDHHLQLDKVFEVLQSLPDKKVLVVMDQVNALFSTTSYSTKDSKPIDANYFKLVQSIYKLINGTKNIVMALDESQSLIKSRFLHSLAQKSVKLNSDPLDLTLDRYEMPNFKGASELSPDITHYGDFKVKCFRVPVFDKEEVKVMLEYFKRVKLGQQQMDHEKYWMWSQGIPLELFRTVSSL